MEEDYLTVGEFARRVNRFPNQIYKLIKEGNRLSGKLKAEQIDGQWMIPASEVDDFYFSEDDKKIKQLKQRVKELEEGI